MKQTLSFGLAAKSLKFLRKQLRKSVNVNFSKRKDIQIRILVHICCLRNQIHDNLCHSIPCRGHGSKHKIATCTSLFSPKFPTMSLPKTGDKRIEVMRNLIGAGIEDGQRNLLKGGKANWAKNYHITGVNSGKIAISLCTICRTRRVCGVRYPKSYRKKHTWFQCPVLMEQGKRL